MKSPRLPRLPRVLACVALALGALAAGCEQILDFPDRGQGKHVAACEGGTCSCQEGFADCDQDASTGCEADLSASPNCGGCGHDCLGGACTTTGCGPVLVEYDSELFHQGPVTFGGDVYITDISSNEVLALRAGSSALTPIGTFEGQAFTLKGNEQGAFLMTVPPVQLTPEGVPPYHATLYRIGADGVSIALELETANLTVWDFAATTKSIYFAVRNWDTGFDELWRVDRASGAFTFFKDTGGPIDAWDDVLYFLDYSDLIAVPDDGVEQVIIDAEINSFHWYVAGARKAYGFDSNDADGEPRLARIDRASGLIEDYRGNAEGLDIDDATACWLDWANGSVMTWSEGAPTPTTVANGQNFDQGDFEAYYCAHDDRAIYWLDLTGLHRMAKPQAP